MKPFSLNYRVCVITLKTRWSSTALLMSVFILLSGCVQHVPVVVDKPIPNVLIDDATGTMLEGKPYPFQLTGLAVVEHFSFETSDYMHMARILEVQRSHRQANWNNLHTKIRFEMTPKDIYFADEKLCRRFKLRYSKQGNADTLNVAACRLPSGDWALD